MIPNVTSIHRYKNRWLMLITSTCSCVCRCATLTPCSRPSPAPAGACSGADFYVHNMSNATSSTSRDVWHCSTLTIHTSPFPAFWCCSTQTTTPYAVPSTSRGVWRCPTPTPLSGPSSAPAGACGGGRRPRHSLSRPQLQQSDNHSEFQPTYVPYIIMEKLLPATDTPFRIIDRSLFPLQEDVEIEE